MNPAIDELTAAVEKEAGKRPEALRLMTHPGLGALTALAYVLIIGTPERFACGKQISNYVGLIPSEDSSGGKQRLGHITKQGSSLLPFSGNRIYQTILEFEEERRLHLLFSAGFAT
jgi:transposase